MIPSSSRLVAGLAGQVRITRCALSAAPTAGQAALPVLLLSGEHWDVVSRDTVNDRFSQAIAEFSGHLQVGSAQGAVAGRANPFNHTITS